MISGFILRLPFLNRHNQRSIIFYLFSVCAPNRVLLGTGRPPLPLVIKSQRFEPQPELMASRTVVAFGRQKSVKSLKGSAGTVLVM